MDTQPGTGASADSPTAPDYAAFERAADAADRAPSLPSGGTTADSPAAQPVDQAASTDAPPVAGSDPAPDKKPKNIDTRLSELDAKNAELRQRLAIKRELEAQLAAREPAKPVSDPATPAPETTAKAWERYKHLPGAPTPDAFDAYEDYLDARADFIVDQKLAARERTAALDRESQGRVTETQQTITGFHDRLKAARETQPDFDAKVHPDLLQVVPAFALPKGQPALPHNVLLQEIVGSEASNALLMHFSSPEGLQEWQGLMAAPNPAALLKAFGRVEARFLSADKPAAPSAAKPVTSAPAPPTVLGKQPPAHADRAGSAVKAGDYSAYEAAADAADRARIR